MLKTVGFPSTRTGDQTIIDGNLVIGTSGKGIDFSADPSAPGMTSELLDDYEEGTFTPTIIGSTTAGTGTYSSQSGTYTKVGRAVSFKLFLEWSAHTGTGFMNVTGLPFTSQSGTGTNTAVAIAYVNNLALSVNYYLQGQIGPNSVNVSLLQSSTGLGSGVAFVNFDTAAGLMISGTYFV